MKKRILCAILAALVACTALTGCLGDGEVPDFRIDI